MSALLDRDGGLSPEIGEETPLEDILDVAVAAGEKGEIGIDDVQETFGDRAFGPVFFLLGLISFVPPIGGIPGVPTVMGLTLFLFSIQMLMGREEIWLPDFIRERSLKTKWLKAVQRRLSGYMEFVDARISKRMSWAVTGASRTLAAVTVSLLSLCMIPLEIIPFAVILPGSAISLIGLSLFARDGLLMMIALGLVAATGYVLFFVTPFVSWIGL